MNRLSHRLLSPTVQRLLIAASLLLPAAGACNSSSSDDTTTVITFTLAITQLDGHAPGEAFSLRCDQPGTPGSNGTPASGLHSTLAVTVSIATDPDNSFALRPANACGESTRCGYVHIEALDESGAVLAGVDTATLEGVLDIPFVSADPAKVAQIRATLLRGLDQEPLKNPDNSAVVATASAEIAAPEDCKLIDTGSGGAASGGAGGAGSEPTAGGAGGEPNQPPAGGAGGDTNVPAGGAGGDVSAAGGIGGV
jgi:hypothetical protein